MATDSSTTQRWFALIAMNLLVLVVLLCLIELSATVILWVRPFVTAVRSSNSIESDGRVNSPIYSDKNAARRMFREQSAVRIIYEPYVTWSLSRFEGTAVNIDSAGQRRTCYNTAASTDIAALKIYMFGGSTLFGTGTDDCGTIASLLAREIAVQHPDLKFEVVNFGTTGYQSTQELMRLLRELQKGSRPEWVLFYDGVNDVYAGAYSPGIPGAHENLDAIAAMFNSGVLNIARRSKTFELVSYLQLRLTRGAGLTDEPALASKIRGTAETYRTNVEILAGLSHTFGFQFMAYWQPELLDGSKPMSAFEGRVAADSGILNTIYRRSYENVRALDFHGLPFVDLSREFEHVPDDVYIDFCHMGERGNERVARAVYNSLRDRLTKRPV